MRQIKIGNITETVVERADYPPERLQADPGQRNRGRPRLRRAGPRPVAQHEGQRRQRHHRPARQGPRLGPGRSRTAGCPARRSSPLEEAAQRGTIVQYLLSDAGQKEQWPTPQAAA